MLSLTLHGAIPLGHGGETFDIGVNDGTIVAVEKSLPRGERAYDLGGKLVTPGFCESHIHLDKACILERCSLKGGIQDAIAEVATLKGAFTEEDVAARARRALSKCIVNGTQFMRTHVEVDPTVGLTGFHGVRTALQDMAFAVDATICVFPQDGLTNLPGTEELLVEALQRGAHSIGAAPYVDPDPKGQIDRIFALARRFDVDVDMHLDFGGDPSALDIEHVMARTDEYGWGGRVTVGHVTRFARLSPQRFEDLSRRLADAGVAVTVLPATDLYLMHRDHTGDMDPPRGVTPLHRHGAHGVTCSLATNNILNPFTPYGDGSALRQANLYANIAQLGGAAAMVDCFEMITDGPAKLMNLAGYGNKVGTPADLVVMDCDGPAAAVAELCQPLYAFKSGSLTVSRAAPQIHCP
ncbi:MAG: amidohydrolase family protein [Pseudomonadota bacterium]